MGLCLQERFSFCVLDAERNTWYMQHMDKSNDSYLIELQTFLRAWIRPIPVPSAGLIVWKIDEETNQTARPSNSLADWFLMNVRVYRAKIYGDAIITGTFEEGKLFSLDEKKTVLITSIMKRAPNT